MRLLLPFDTETTGIPLWKDPSDHPDQPHLLEVGALLINEDTDEVVETLDVIIRPDGWVVTEEITGITGITHAYAMEHGIPEAEALARLLAMIERAGLRIAHNRTFDDRILRIAIKRYLGVEAADAFKARQDGYCTMWESRPICAIPQPGKRSGIKLPKLEEAYEFFTGRAYAEAHRALPDAQACFEVYRGIRDHQQKNAAVVASDGIGISCAATATVTPGIGLAPEPAAPAPVAADDDTFAVS